jgi:ferredoxin|tara:strand:+ start:9613 stop:9807 length:195 start_codon:yes stop_codon:yes gene_type:complete
VKIKIEVERCVGHARCAAVAPEVFSLDDNGFNTTEKITVPEALEEKAARGARACPEMIILVEED